MKNVQLPPLIPARVVEVDRDCIRTQRISNFQPRHFMGPGFVKSIQPALPISACVVEGSLDSLRTHRIPNPHFRIPVFQ